MESAILVEGFKKSIEMHNLIYGRLISDGDANTYAKLLEARPYKNLTIEKIECRNHLLRNLCNKLQSMTTDTKYPIKYRKYITKRRILSVRKVVLAVIAQYKGTDNAIQLHKDIMSSAEHAFGQHSKCKRYYCQETADDDNIPKEMFTSSIWQRTKLILSQLAGHARSLLHDVDSNAVERYHSIVAKIVGGKRINFSQKYQYNMRCNVAALSFNTKKPLSKLHKSIVGKSPRGSIKRFECKNIKQLEQSRSYAKRKRRLFDDRKESGINYGDNCSKPDISEEMMEVSKKAFLADLTKSDEERNKIQLATILQSESSEWLELRRNLLTASNFGRVIKRRMNTSCSNIVKDIIYKKSIDHVMAIKHGKDNEELAKKQLEKEINVKVKPCGLFIDKEQPYLGASPDGVIDEDTIVEIKCPITAYKIGLEKAIADKKIPFYKKTTRGDLEINEHHNWYYQIQGQLHVTQKKKCIFALWSGENHKLKLETIYRDDQFWNNKMQEKLSKFYLEHMLPELVDPRFPRKMPIRDTAREEQAPAPEVDNRSPCKRLMQKEEDKNEEIDEPPTKQRIIESREF